MGKKVLILFLSTFIMTTLLSADKTLDISKPSFHNDKPLYYALQNRKSTRSFSSKELDKNTLSDLLWAACGVNRKNGEKNCSISHE